MTGDLLENLQGILALSSNSAFEIICVFYFFVLKKNLAKCSFISKITRRANIIVYPCLLKSWSAWSLMTVFRSL